MFNAKEALLDAMEEVAKAASVHLKEPEGGEPAGMGA